MPPTTGVSIRVRLLKGPKPGHPTWELAWQVFLVLVVAGLVYWPFLGFSGFAFSEGQRVFPGWEMARHGDWFLPRLLGQPYLRKPPGMPWAEALASILFGENEFSARSVSALAMTAASLMTFGFATRWFGRPWGLISGIAYALTPLFWLSPTSPIGRSAEIEALHNFFVEASMLVAIELLVRRPRGWAGAGWGAVFAASLFGMAMVKGPAGLPCVGGAVIGACVAVRSARPLRSAWAWGGIVAAACALGVVAWRIWVRVHQLSEPPVMEPATRFLWREDVISVLLLPLVTLAAGLPSSMALLLSLWRGGARRDDVERALVWTCLVSLAIYTAVGVSNNRYAMPAITILPVLWAPVVRRHFERPPASRPLLDRVLMNRPLAWGLVVLVGSFVSMAYTEQRRAHRTSGEPGGVALGEALPNGAEVWGGWLADNRPEVLYYAQRRAAELGKSIEPRWVPGIEAGEPIPPPGKFLALTEGDGADEIERYTRSGSLAGLQEVFRGRVHKFEFRVYRNPG